MTKAQKEKQRSLMMWIALLGIIFVMFGILLLVYFDKNVEGLGVIATGFFTALAGVNGASFFSKPSPGAEDENCNEN